MKKPGTLSTRDLEAIKGILRGETPAHAMARAGFPPSRVNGQKAWRNQPKIKAALLSYDLLSPDTKPVAPAPVVPKQAISAEMTPKQFAEYVYAWGAVEAFKECDEQIAEARTRGETATAARLLNMKMQVRGLMIDRVEVKTVDLTPAFNKMNERDNAYTASKHRAIEVKKTDEADAEPEDLENNPRYRRSVIGDALEHVKSSDEWMEDKKAPRPTSSADAVKLPTAEEKKAQHLAEMERLGLNEGGHREQLPHDSDSRDVLFPEKPLSQQQLERKKRERGQRAIGVDDYHPFNV